MMLRAFGSLLVCSGLLGCSAPTPAPIPATPYVETTTEVDSARVLADFYFLSHPALEGRAPGTPGNAAARAYLEAELRAARVDSFPQGWEQEFSLPGEGVGRNVIGVIEGSENPDRFLVLSAHFDHLGIRGGELYPGADDNASGSAALLEIARYLTANRPHNSVIIAAFDAEEMGLLGARAFVADPPVPLRSIVLDINMDMVSRNSAGELYLAGAYHYPALAALADSVAERSTLTLLQGHDRPDLPPGDDWTSASDHGAFHAAGVPFAYFGVEDHPDYHRPTDTFENADPAFFVQAVRTVLDFVNTADRNAARIVPEPN